MLGDYYFDALTSMGVQEWLNGASRKTNPKTRKPYDPHTVFGWWKVLRTTVRDAALQLGLPRDPTRRIFVPELTAKGGNSLTVETLARLLAVIREAAPGALRVRGDEGFDGDAGVPCVGAPVGRQSTRRRA